MWQNCRFTILYLHTVVFSSDTNIKEIWNKPKWCHLMNLNWWKKFIVHWYFYLQIRYWYLWLFQFCSMFYVHINYTICRRVIFGFKKNTDFDHFALQVHWTWNIFVVFPNYLNSWISHSWWKERYITYLTVKNVVIVIKLISLSVENYLSLIGWWWVYLPFKRFM